MGIASKMEADLNATLQSTVENFLQQTYRWSAPFHEESSALKVISRGEVNVLDLRIKIMRAN